MLHQIKVNKKAFLFRSWLLFGVSMALLFWMYLHTFYLQVYENQKYELSSLKNYVKLIPKPPERGLISDRNGIGLAVNRRQFGLFLTPVSSRKAKAIFQELQEIIPLTEDDYENYLDNKRNNIFKSPSLVKAGLTEEQVARLLVNKYRFPEIDVEPIYNRFYPYGNLIPHQLGYVGSINDRDAKNIDKLPEQERANYAGTSIIGKIGIEKSYEKQLLGTIGYDYVEVNSTGEILKVIESKDAIQGQNLRLAIDLPTQVYIKSLLLDRKAAVVLTDPQTSEVIAMVSNPGFDINLFVNGISYKNYKDLLEDPDKPLYNRTSMGIYPPGSTIKPFMSFSGLASGFIDKKYALFDPGYWILPGTTQKYRDWLRTGHGKVDVHLAITESVDTFFYDLAHRMGITKMNEYMTQFGFGSKTGLDINEESAALYPSTEWKEKRFGKPWLDGDTPPVGIGQGYFTATPVQLVNALNTLINKGTMREPHLLASYSEANDQHQYSIKTVHSPSHKIFENVKKDHWDTVLYGMWGVANQPNGSGYRAFYGTSYEAGGKSGTAQVFGLKGSDYHSSKLDKSLHDHALFIAFAPYESPKVSVAVVVENGGGGSKVAGPIARDILDYYLDHRLPRLNKNLTCKQIQDYAIEDVEKLGLTVNRSKDLLRLENLTPLDSTCKHER